MNKNTITKAFDDLAEARRTLYAAAEVTRQAKLDLETKRLLALFEGRIEGKNEDLRKYAVSVMFTTEIATHCDAEAAEDIAKLNLSLMTDQVDMLKLLAVLE